LRNNELRPQLRALPCHEDTFLRCIELPESKADWSLTSLQIKPIKIGTRVVRHYLPDGRGRRHRPDVPC
jgi:hypothetical protein